MGGHAKGDIASKTACEVIVETLMNSGTNSFVNSIAQSIKIANERVFELGQSENNSRGMGTTLVVALIKNNELYYANVGDSRLYLIRGGKIIQLSEDHSFVAEMVKSGIISEQEAKIHPRRNEITRAIGIRPTVEPTICSEPLLLQKGDFVLLCTDGLTNMVHEETILEIIGSSKSVDSKAQQLIDEANDAGGLDNITATLIEIEDESGIFTKLRQKRFLLLFTLLSVIGIMGFVKLLYVQSPVSKNKLEVNSTINGEKNEDLKNKEADKSINPGQSDTIKELPQKKSLSVIQYDLSCMNGKDEASMMDLVNLMSSTRDDMVDAIADKVSLKKEMEYGKTVYEDISKKSTLKANAKLEKILRKILTNSLSTKYNYHIFEIVDETVNAFTVGGYIYVHSGMLKFVQSDDELAGVIAHEVNHNELGHINKKLRMSKTAESFVGKEASDIAMALEGIVTSSFNQKDETMCDLYGVDLMILSGYDPCAAIDLWNRMAKDESAENALDEMMRTHPYSSKRAVCIKHHLLNNYKHECDQ